MLNFLPTLRRSHRGDECFTRAPDQSSGLKLRAFRYFLCVSSNKWLCLFRPLGRSNFFFAGPTTRDVADGCFSVVCVISIFYSSKSSRRCKLWVDELSEVEKNEKSAAFSVVGRVHTELRFWDKVFYSWLVFIVSVFTSFINIYF